MSIHQLGVSIAVLWFRFVYRPQMNDVAYVIYFTISAKDVVFRDSFSRSMFKLTTLEFFWQKCFSSFVISVMFYLLREWISRIMDENVLIVKMNTLFFFAFSLWFRIGILDWFLMVFEGFIQYDVWKDFGYLFLIFIMYNVFKIILFFYINIGLIHSSSYCNDLRIFHFGMKLFWN